MNLLASSIGTILTALLSLVGYPIYLYYLDLETYGTWLTLSVINAFIQLGAIGFGPAVTKFVAEDLAESATHRISASTSTASTVVACISAIPICTSFVFSRPICDLIGLNGSMKDTAAVFLPWIVVLSFQSLVVQIRGAALAGLGRADLVALSLLIGRATTLTVSWISLGAGMKIGALLLGQFVGGVATHIATAIWSRREGYIPLFLAPAISHKEVVRLISFGRALVGNSAMQLLLQPANRLLLARYAGVSSVPIFEIAWSGSMQIRGVLATAFQALLPDFSQAMAQKNQLRIRGLLKRSYQLIFLAAPGFILLILFTDLLLRLWLKESLAPNQAPPMRVMLVSAWLSLVSVPAYYHLLSAGRPAQVFVAHVLLSLTNLLSAFVFAHFDSLTPYTLCFSVLLGIAASTVWLLTQSFVTAKAHG